MAVVRYVIDLGLANEGGTPSFGDADCHFKRLDTLVDITAPAIIEIADGKFYFPYDWSTAPAGVDSITWKIVYNGTEDSGVINGTPSPGSYVPGLPSGAYSGYATAGTLIGRALVRLGIQALTPAQIATLDPFASSDQNVVLLLDLLRSVGADLASEVKAGLYKDATITTAGGASSYLFPDDLAEMVEQTTWTGSLPLLGPVNPQGAAYLKAWNATGTIYLPFQVQARVVIFPVVPADGTVITYQYVSSYWVQSVGATSGDKAAPTVSTDVVLFDDELVIRALRLRFRELKGFDTATDLKLYQDQLVSVKGANTPGQVLSLNGNGFGPYLVDERNMPYTQWGLP